MATNTSYTFLCKVETQGSTTTYTKLLDIKDYPDIGSAPDTLATTSLSDLGPTAILGIGADASAMAFKANYDATAYATVKGLVGSEKDFAIIFGHPGTGGTTVSGSTITPATGDAIISFKGYADIVINGGAVNAVREMTAYVSNTTVPVHTVSA